MMMMTFALLRNSIDLHICKGLYVENNDRFFNPWKLSI